MNDWRVLHGELIKDFTSFLNSKSNKFVLKGGTSLMLCYNLTRFSEDIDLDGFDCNSFFTIVDLFVQSARKKYAGITYRVAKDTETVKRVLVHYGGDKPLKIEVSFRKKSVSQEEVTIINGILVYTVESILLMKLNAFNHRDKIRDLFDIVFIYTHFKSYLSRGVLFMLADAVSFKGLEQFDYLIKDQEDPLIDNNALADSILLMYYDLGLN